MTSYSVEGYVRDNKTNAGIVSAKITFANKTVYSSIDGYYKITLDGGYSGIITCERDGYYSQTKAITVSGPIRVDFYLEPIMPTYSVEGYVRDNKTNAGIVSAKITFANKTVYSSIDGYYKITLDGGYSGIITCERDGYYSQTKAITVSGPIRVDFYLEPIMPTYYQLIGKVTDAQTGSPIAGAQVITPYGSKTTGSDGSYAFTFTEGWSGVVRCTAGGYNPQEKAITLRPGENQLNFALVKPQYSVEGYVRDNKTNAGIVSAKITFANKTVYSSIDGYYKITLDGGYSGIITCERDGYYSQTKAITVSGPIRVDFYLEPIMPTYYQLIGKVTDAQTGSPIAGAQVITPYGSKTTGSDGSYAFTFTEGWSGVVRCTAGGYNPQEKAITLRPGENQLNFALVKGIPQYSTLEGYVKDKETLQPINGAQVFWKEEERITGVDGYFIYDRRPVGEQGILKVLKEGYVSFEQPITLAQGINQVEILISKTPVPKPELWLPLVIIIGGLALYLATKRKE